MNFKRSVLALVVLMVFSAQAAVAQEKAEIPAFDSSKQCTLKDAVERSLAANPDMIGARAALSGSEKGVYKATSDMLPTASLTYGWTHLDQHPEALGVQAGDQEYWSSNIKVTQPIFKGFGLLSARQRAKLTEEQTTAKLDNVELQLINAVQSTFVGLIEARMKVKSAEDSVERLKSQQKVTQAFYDVGLNPRVDVLDSEVKLAQAELELLSSRNNVSTTEARLNTLLNLPLSDAVNYVGDLEFPDFTKTLEESLAAAFKKRPDLLIGKKSVQIAMEDVDLAEAGFYPGVDAVYNYNSKGDDPLTSKSKYNTHNGEDNWNVGLQMSWNFFESGSDYFARAQALDGVKEVAAQLEKTRLDAGYEVKNAFLKLTEARDRITVANKSVEAAREAYRMQVARYQAQVGTNNDVLDAQDRVTSSEADLISAKADFARSQASLYQAMGERNIDLGM
ncbi:MAG: TolC family protein [Desulfovibrio sp.]